MNADADTLKVSATGAMKHLWSGHTKVALWSAPNSRTRNKTASPFFSTRRKSPDTAQNRIRKERFCSRWGGHPRVLWKNEGPVILLIGCVMRALCLSAGV